MKELFDTYRPDGFGTVNTYLFVENPEELIHFLKNVFYAEEQSRTIRPDTGDIANVILKVGHSCIMLSQAAGQFLSMRTALYLYTSDVDALHQRALDHGAQLVFDPADMPYGDRQSGVVDPAGNYWWISERLVHQEYTDG